MKISFEKIFRRFFSYSFQSDDILFKELNYQLEKNILVIDRHIPFFDKDAGSYRMFNLVKILQELKYNVTFIGDDLHHSVPYDSALEQEGVHVIYSPKIRSIKQFLSQYGQFFTIIILSRPDIAKKHINNVRKYCKNAKIIYDTVDLRFIRLLRNAEIRKDKYLFQNAVKSKKLEMALARNADFTLVVSSYEMEILLQEEQSLKVQVLSLTYPISPPKKDFFERSGILFLGGFLHSPNIDGVEWFVSEIFPKIREKIPEIKFFIVGDNPTKELQRLSSDQIIITGYISNLTNFFENSRVFVAPLRYGAGIKGKICHSMSYGLPIVTTSIGAEGLGVLDGYNALIADDAVSLSEKVIKLYNDENLWNSISKNSLEYIRINYSYEKGKEDIRNFFESIS